MRAASRFALSWAAAMAAWFVLVAKLELAEVAAGALVAALATALAEATRAGGDIHLRRPGDGLARWLSAPLDVVRDVAVLVRALPRAVGRAPSGSAFLAVPLDVPEDGPTRAGRDVEATIGITLTPNTYVVGADHERALVLVHQLRPDPDPSRTLSTWTAPDHDGEADR